MSRLLITSYSAIENTVRRYKPSHLLTLMVDPIVPTPDGIAPHRHLRLSVHDIDVPIEGSVAPARSHIVEMLDFAKDWDKSAPFLVHCWAGVSRSTAAAFILLCDLHGSGHEDRIARGLRYYAPHAQPNRLIVRLADAHLKRDGRMIAAIASLPMTSSSWVGEVAELPLNLDEL